MIDESYNTESKSLNEPPRSFDVEGREDFQKWIDEELDARENAVETEDEIC